MIQIKYKQPREILGEYLAKTFRDMRWEQLYNTDQKEYWCNEADKLIIFMKRNNIFG